MSPPWIVAIYGPSTLFRYPGAYIADGRDWNTPTPTIMDKFMTAALSANVTPVLLFECVDCMRFMRSK